MIKTRHLSLLDYLEILQKEYFICEIRSRFYHNPKDKQYYKRVSEGKKAKITKIGSDNNIPNIFTNDNLFSKIKDKVYPVNGLPQFEMTQLDIEHYYSIGSDVRCLVDDSESAYGKVVKNLIKSQKILVKFKYSDEEKYVTYQHATRIF